MPISLSDLLPLLALGPAALVAVLDALDQEWGWVGDDLAFLCVGAAFFGALLGRELPAVAPVAPIAVFLALLLWALRVALGDACRAWGRRDPHPPRRLALCALALGALWLGQAVAPPGPVKSAPGLHAAGPRPSMEVSR